MGEISLDPGETQKLISQPGDGEEYNLGVSGADIYLSHRKGLVVEEGKRVRPGDRVTVNNLRGKSLYAKNPPGNASTASVDINRAGFGLFFQPRAVQATVQTSEDSESAPATDSYTNATASGADISNGGSVTETFTPPGRSKQLSIHAEGAAAFEVQVGWNNTAETYASDANNVVKETLPVYYIDDDIDVTFTDTANAANSVDYDMTVV